MEFEDIFEDINKFLVIIIEGLTILSIIDSLSRSSYLTTLALSSIGAVFLYFIIRYYYFGKKYAFYTIYEKESLLIKDRTGKLAHFKDEWTFRPNHPYISQAKTTITSDGTIKNFFATISDNSISCNFRILSYFEKFKIAELTFSKHLKKNKEYKVICGFDFINSYTQNQEYHVFRIEGFDKIFSFSVVFPIDRIPEDISCFCTKGEILLLKDLSPTTIILLPDGYKEYNWVIKRPRIGDTYKVKWGW